MTSELDNRFPMLKLTLDRMPVRGACRFIQGMCFVDPAAVKHPVVDAFIRQHATEISALYWRDYNQPRWKRWLTNMFRIFR